MRANGISPFRAGLIAVVLIALLSYFGFTKSNPFAHPYELHAVFDNVNNLKPNSPVRIAGVDVGKVTKVEPVSEGEGAARVTMEIKKRGLPIHRDATVKVRSRIFLEGKGSAGFNQSIKYWEPAYKNSALANDATLGEEPSRDLQRVLGGQQRTFAALDADEDALRGLVTNFNTTAAAFASQDRALSASVPALRDTLRAAQPALASLNGALPSLRRFAVDALPGARSSNPTLAAGVPFIRQARRLMGRRELRGLAAELRRQVRNLVALNTTSVPVLTESRALSACTHNVLIPFIRSRIPDPDMAQIGNTNQMVRWQIQRIFPGLAGESRLIDGNNHAFHASSVPPSKHVRPAPPADGGSQPPEHRPDVPCETQEPPNLDAPDGDTSTLTYTPTAGAKYVRSGPVVSRGQFRRAVLRARRKWPSVERVIAQGQLKNLRFFKRFAR